MVIDTSALICILLSEPEAAWYAKTLVQGSTPVLSAVNWLETMRVVVSRRGEAGRQGMDELLTIARVVVAPVDARLAQMALDAWLRYGKGRHPAGLNFGDCFAYALAKQRGEPLLFKGDDFSKTDVSVVL